MFVRKAFQPCLSHCSVRADCCHATAQRPSHTWSCMPPWRVCRRAAEAMADCKSCCKLHTAHLGCTFCYTAHAHSTSTLQCWPCIYKYKFSRQSGFTIAIDILPAVYTTCSAVRHWTCAVECVMNWGHLICEVQIAATVGELANHGLHHGDLSPSNILPETATLIDFQTLSRPGVCWHCKSTKCIKVACLQQS